MRRRTDSCTRIFCSGSRKRGLVRACDRAISVLSTSHGLRPVPSRRTCPGTSSSDSYLGLACGIGLAFVLESLDTTVRTMEEIRAISTLPALGTIPLQFANNGVFRKRLKTVSRRDEKSGIACVWSHMRVQDQKQPRRTDRSALRFFCPRLGSAQSDSRHQRLAARRKNHHQRKFSAGLGAAGKPCIAGRCGPASARH